MLKSYPNVLDLGFDFNPVKPAYWTSLPHHRRTPFAVTVDGSVGYLAYLDGSETDVHVIQINTTSFTAIGKPVTIAGAKEAGGLIAHSDGFALLTNINETNSGTDYPIPALVRYQNGKEAWRTWLGGPDVDTSFGAAASPDLNGDLVYSYNSSLYGAYFVVTDYTGDAAGHFGDSVKYINLEGKLQDIPEASAWGCSHNTGIAFEAASAPPFASICAEDHGAIWLNTDNRGMSLTGVKISGENTTNGASGEPMGGMSGSYSSLSKYAHSNAYIFAWATRGCVDLTQDTWMGQGFTQCYPRTLNHNVAIATFSDKYTLVGKPAISTVGAKDGDSQLNLVTNSTTVDHANVHVASFSKNSAVVMWEQVNNPSCTNVAMGCSGEFAGTYFQEVDGSGNKVGATISSNSVYVAGDMTLMSYNAQKPKICWPYVDMTWDLSKPLGGGLPTTTVSKMSFACLEK
ncbi:hypothetical protein NA57DRAFT_81080 [Rhizodiscina lignyota]|uniref:Uncharacterized protein n=1 Tax=Rhizodiscina lignyota TaxID=1504668 RepID=A0A9P4M581_9PEZI|nr:hypothetical protein NA57DRAFT_81080 [Rhizodiscina lignyota]